MWTAVQIISAERRRLFLNGTLAVVLYFLAQFLICGLDIVITSVRKDFPAPIVAMILVFVLMLLLGLVWPGEDGFYERWLKEPTDLLNKHMSIGFTVPFFMIAKEPIASPKNIGLIIALFLITGILNTASVYVMAWLLQSLLSTIHVLHRGPSTGDHWSRKLLSLLPPRCRWRDVQVVIDHRGSGGSSCFSSASTLTNGPSDQESGSDDKNSDTTRNHLAETTGAPTTTDRPKSTSNPDGIRQNMKLFLLQHPILLLCLLSIPIIGIPVSIRTGNDTITDTTVVFTLWLGFQAAQGYIKQAVCLRPHPRCRVFLAAFLNAVLWTSLAMIAYALVKSAAQRRSLADTLSALQSNTTVADLLLRNRTAVAAGSSEGIAAAAGSGFVQNTTLHSAGQLAASTSATTPLQATPSLSAGMAAGDVALSILDAGLVAWGFKLYECRSQLLSRAGVTVSVVAAVSAASNVFLGPLLARATGLAPAARDLSFAARSVTLALAVPAMGVVGGDASLNAAMVVGSGVVFQMGMGLGVGKWLGIVVARCAGLRRTRERRDGNGESLWCGSIWILECGGSSRGDERPAGASHCRANGESVEEDTERNSGDRIVSLGTGHIVPSDENDRKYPQPQLRHGQPDLESRCADQEPRRSVEREDEEGTPAVNVAPRGNGDPREVAAGVTVGINAAAMGTAHLYERGSRAAPYSALAMTAFGVVTVVLTNLLAGWLVQRVSP